MLDLDWHQNRKSDPNHDHHNAKYDYNPQDHNTTHHLAYSWQKVQSADNISNTQCLHKDMFSWSQCIQTVLRIRDGVLGLFSRKRGSINSGTSFVGSENPNNRESKIASKKGKEIMNFWMIWTFPLEGWRLFLELRSPSRRLFRIHNTTWKNNMFFQKTHYSSQEEYKKHFAYSSSERIMDDL